MMRKSVLLLALVLACSTPPLAAEVNEDEIAQLRQQIELLSKRLDQLESQNQALTAQAEAAENRTLAAVEPLIEEKVDSAVTEQVAEQRKASSWADRVRWKGDFRYRYENIDEEGKDSRNRSRIRARAHLEADLSPTLEVGIGLATGGDDPVSSNQTIGAGGSSKDIKLDLAYFDWSGLKNTRIVGGKFQNLMYRPSKMELMWDSDWRPEGLGAAWDNGTFFVQGMGTWLQGDSKLGTEFAFLTQAGMNLKVGDNGKLTFGGGFSEFDIAGATPLFGAPDDFYGNSFEQNPACAGSALCPNVFKYDYRMLQAFVNYDLSLGSRKLSLFGDYVHNTAADENNTGYLLGAKYGANKNAGDWALTYFYKNLEADAVVGLLANSDFAGGGTDGKGHVLSGSYTFHPGWYFKATYFINKRYISSDPRDFDRLMLDINFKFK